MDDGRIDRAARALGLGRSRRAAARILVGAVTGGAASAAGLLAAFPACRGADEPCTLWVPCCGGLACVAPRTNPNDGVCRPASSVPTPVPTPTRAPRMRSDNRTPTPSPIATGTAAATQDVEIRLACEGQPEETTIENAGDETVTVEEVESLHEPRPNEEPYEVSDKVRPGKSITYETGTGAKGKRELSGNEIYDNEATDEGVRVVTSAGTFTAECGSER